MKALSPDRAPALILAASVLVLGTALASQYWGGLVPCELCIYQRWPYVATGALSAVAIVFLRPPGARRVVAGLCALIFLVGGAIAFYHTGVEQGWFAGPSACTGVPMEATTVEELQRQLFAAPIVRCDEVQWSLFGISLAGYNVIASLVLAAASAVMAFNRGAAR